MFYEGGNYSAEEAKIFAYLLEVIDKEIRTEIKILITDINKEELNLLKKCDDEFSLTRNM